MSFQDLLSHTVGPHFRPFLTSTNQAIGPITVEVITLAEFAGIDFVRVVPLAADTLPAHALPIVAADLRAVLLPAVGVHVLAVHLVRAALTLSANTALVAPEPRSQNSTCIRRNNREPLSLQTANIK